MYSGCWLYLFRRCCGARRPVTICGDGEQSRDFTFIDNVVERELDGLPCFGVAGGGAAS